MKTSASKHQQYAILIILVILLIISLVSCTRYTYNVYRTPKDVMEYTDRYVDYLEQELINAKGQNYFLDCITETDEYQNYYEYASEQEPYMPWR